MTGAVGGQVLANATVGAGVIMLATNGILARGYWATPAPHASPLVLPRRGHAAVTVRGRGPSASARRAPWPGRVRGHDCQPVLRPYPSGSKFRRAVFPQMPSSLTTYPSLESGSANRVCPPRLGSQRVHGKRRPSLSTHTT